MEAAARYGSLQLVMLESTDAGVAEPINGSFSGMLGRLQRGETDVALGAYALTPRRLQHFRATVPFLDVESRIHVRCGGPSGGHLASGLARLWSSGLFVFIVMAAAAVVSVRLLATRCSRSAVTALSANIKLS
ncbi:hypothetical protein ONE63_008030 [Megalurothrips usitatus]|uniref:Uncharacterized protein n=1 Tax=Megalurothrips usitatus TaxID=439358 RepID=A0AAV7XSW1_9NEOP|nr:hypothetical protein ONE63_008030 [Megalurothrips usitatus]